jgi:exodeoxyribonuclease V beta subunit
LEKIKLDILNCEIKGSNLIEASAGTGKTYTITALFLRMIIENNLKVSEILVVTFTKAATAELKDRIYNTLNNAKNYFKNDTATGDDFLDELKNKQSDIKESIRKIENAIRDLDECSIFTIHSFCRRILIENVFESHSLYDTEIISDQSEYILDAINDFWRENLYNAEPYIIEEFIKEGLDNLYNEYSLRERNPELKIEFTSKSNTDLKQLRKDLITSYNQVKNSLPKTAEELVKLLKIEQLNGNTYNKKINDYAQEILDYFTGDFLEFKNLPKKIELFTNDHILKKIKKNQNYTVEHLFQIIQDFYKVYQEYLETKNTHLLKLKSKMFDEIDKKLQTNKNIHNVQSFGDFLFKLKNALNHNNNLAKSIRKKFKAALIDEFQDTDVIQYEIFNKLFSEDKILFLIGDPKQAIYSFRGADIYSYLKASKDVAKRYTLDTNYRTDDILVNSINELFGVSENPFIEKDIEFQKINADKKQRLFIEDENYALTFWYKNEVPNVQDATNDAVKNTAYEIYRILKLSQENKAYIQENDEQRKILPSDFAILVRKKDQMQPLQDELRKYNIPSVLSGTISVFDSSEALSIKRFIETLLTPNNISAVKTLMTEIFFTYDSKFIDEIEDKNAEEFEKFIVNLKKYIIHYENNGFISMFNEFMNDYNVKENIIVLKSGERKLTNILQLVEILHEKSVQSSMKLIELYKWFTIQIKKPALRQEETELRMETDDISVNIMTIHKSKGLEFPIVFAPFTWGSLNPKSFIYHKDGKTILNLDDKDKIDERVKQKSTKESLAEDLRLYYVALTRAKHRCYTFFPNFKSNSYAIAPFYLLALENEIKQNNDIDFENEFKNKKNKLKIPDLLEKYFDKNNINIKEIDYNFKYEKLELEANKLNYSYQKFNKKIEKGFKIISFSMLTNKTLQEEYNEKDIDRTTIADEEKEILPNEKNIFTLPKGAKTGLMLHEFLEYLDFTNSKADSTRKLLKKLLYKYGIDDEFENIILDMTNNLLTKKLNNSFSLSQITNEKRINEMEFYFSIKDFNINKFREILSNSNLNQLFKDRMLNFDFENIKGFMKGFIDLIFEYEGKFYIIDWKSNHLGNSYEDYEYPNLTESVASHYYFLQYLIYGVALNRYLKQNIKDYDYNKYFGGVFYIFLRGVNNKNNDYGIYYDLPDKELMRNLDDCF